MVPFDYTIRPVHSGKKVDEGATRIWLSQPDNIEEGDSRCRERSLKQF